MKLVGRGQLDPTVFATHHFALGDTMAAYDTFADAATTDELKVVLSGTEGPGPRDVRESRPRPPPDLADRGVALRFNVWHAQRRLAR